LTFHRTRKRHEWINESDYVAAEHGTILAHRAADGMITESPEL
jgi:hypothetical protein